MLIIADDLTGAAEVAAMAPKGAVVVATNTRSMTEDDAIAETQRIIASRLTTNTLVSEIFKKTDSALRGHIVAELQCLMQMMNAKKCLLIPQNPTRRRFITEGQYRIDGVLLHETSFRDDPEYPITSSRVEDLLRGARYLPLDAPLQEGINIAEATSLDDIKTQLRKSDDETLLAGGADFFGLITTSATRQIRVKDCLTKRIIIVQGSTLSNNLRETDFYKTHNFNYCPMPDDVFHGAERTDWACHNGNVCLCVGHKEKGDANHLKKMMAATTKTLIERTNDTLSTPLTLIIEGGATAFATLMLLKWYDLELLGQLAPGVVALRHGKDTVILKPGSYPWGKELFE